MGIILCPLSYHHHRWVDVFGSAAQFISSTPLRPVGIEEICVHVYESKIFPQLLGRDESPSQSCFLPAGGAQMTRLPSFWVARIK